MVVTLDEEGYVEVDVTLGAFPGKQKVMKTSNRLLNVRKYKQLNFKQGWLISLLARQKKPQRMCTCIVWVN